jgi:hypothetical protein
MFNKNIQEIIIKSSPNVRGEIKSNIIVMFEKFNGKALKIHLTGKLDAHNRQTRRDYLAYPKHDLHITIFFSVYIDHNFKVIIFFLSF